MATTTRETTAFENTITEEATSRVAGVAVGLRLLMGWIFLTAGIGKLTGEPFDAAGYLVNVDPASPAVGVYGAMATHPALMDLVNVAVPWGQVLIGIGLLVGGLVRLAIGALAAGRVYGIDAILERYEVDGEPLIERHPRLRYVLG